MRVNKILRAGGSSGQGWEGGTGLERSKWMVPREKKQEMCRKLKYMSYKEV